MFATIVGTKVNGFLKAKRIVGNIMSNITTYLGGDDPMHLFNHNMRFPTNSVHPLIWRLA